MDSNKKVNSYNNAKKPPIPKLSSMTAINYKMNANTKTLIRKLVINYNK